MEEFWIALTPFMKTVWCITIFSSLVFIVQTIMTFAGMDSDGGMDVDPDGLGDGSGPFQLFTFRNFINFFLGFGWSLITFEKMMDSPVLWILLSALVGALLVVAVLFIFRFLSRMEQSGNIDLSRAINSKGNVYLKIPAAKKGEGKVQISIQGAVREYNALTEGEELETGAPIKVVGVIDNHTLMVERF